MVVLPIGFFHAFTQLGDGQTVCLYLAEEAKGDHAIGLDDYVSIERGVGHGLDGDFVSDVDPIGFGEFLAGQTIDEIELVAHTKAILSNVGSSITGDVLALLVGPPVVGTD